MNETPEEVLNRILDEEQYSNVNTDDLLVMMRFCATDPLSSEMFERMDTEILRCFITRLLDISLEGRADIDESTVDERRARISMRTMVNAFNRSKKLKSSFPFSSIDQWRSLLRIGTMKTEMYAALVSVAEIMHKMFSLHSDYTRLLGELSILWEQSNEEDRSWLSTLFSIHLEQDAAFLAHSFADFRHDEYCSLLNCTETLLDSSETGKLIPIHSNNIQFVVDLVDRIIYDFGEGMIDEERKKVYMEWMVYLVEIIANASLHSSLYQSQLSEKTTATSLIRRIIETIVDAEAAEMIVNPPAVVTASDRPKKPIMERRKNIMNSPSLSALSHSLQSTLPELRSNLKCASIRAIGNLSSSSLSNQLEAGREDGVLLVLSCANLGPNDRPFIVQWCISALRHMTLDCPQNQSIIAGIDQRPTGVLDRQRLLQELGLKCTVDAEGRVTVKSGHN